LSTKKTSECGRAGRSLIVTLESVDLARVYAAPARGFAVTA
jgi:hypothetical protein